MKKLVPLFMKHCVMRSEWWIVCMWTVIYCVHITAILKTKLVP